MKNAKEYTDDLYAKGSPCLHYRHRVPSKCKLCITDTIKLAQGDIADELLSLFEFFQTATPEALRSWTDEFRKEVNALKEQ